MADDSYLREELSSLRNRLSRVESTSSQNRSLAASAGARLETLDSDLALLTSELRAFTEKVGRLAMLTEARNHIHILDDTLEKRFGRHAAARKCVANLLRAAGEPLWTSARDESLGVLQSLGRDYWLAPAGLAFAAWVDGDRTAAERHSAEAALADERRASLFFALTAHSHRRDDDATAWFARYFSAVNPEAVDDVDVDVFLAACDGVFGAATAQELVSAAKKWCAGELAGREDDAGTRARWEAVLRSKSSDGAAADFPLLREKIRDWREIGNSLEWARLQDGLAKFYTGLAGADAASGEVPVHYAGPAPDAILAGLVAGYAEEEKPLRRERALSRLLVEENGDLDAAAVRLPLVWREKRTAGAFSGFLADMIGGGLVVPDGTKRLALCLAFPWLEAAYLAMRVDAVAAVPARLTLEIDGWSGDTTNGDNDSDLRASLSRFMDRPPADAVKPAWLDEKLLVPGAAMLLVCLVTARTIIVPALAVAAFSYYFLMRTREYETEKEARKAEEEDRRNKNFALLASYLEEVRAYRRLLLLKNREADAAREAMKNADFAPAVPIAGTARPENSDRVSTPWFPVPPNAPQSVSPSRDS